MHLSTRSCLSANKILTIHGLYHFWTQFHPCTACNNLPSPNFCGIYSIAVCPINIDMYCCQPHQSFISFINVCYMFQSRRPSSVARHSENTITKRQEQLKLIFSKNELCTKKCQCIYNVAKTAPTGMN